MEAREGSASQASQRARDAALRSIWSILEELLKAVINALRLLLDPAPLGSYDISLNNSLIKGRLAVHDLLARHLRDTQFHVGLPNPFTMCSEVRVALPNLTLTAFYDADLDVGFGAADGEAMAIFGDGRAQIDLHNAKLTTKVCITLKEFSVKVADMKISLEKAEVNLKGLFGGGAVSDLVNSIVTDVLPDAVEEYEPEITQLAMKYINEFIKKMLHRGSATTATRVTNNCQKEKYVITVFRDMIKI
ncbi:uncharacterized protein LOC117643401 isoform X2 [Thrips palmi]|nr:uncharacterized protein LOC117643401 isoform X2 [Thrips palmi]XP_034238161.1 uncharacterized protein LOC117643401 isoform X2 [Thrips palmi]